MSNGPGLSFTPVFISGPNTWTDMPAAATELFGNAIYRQTILLEGYTQARLSAMVAAAGAGGAVLTAQYTTDLTGAGGWADLVGSNLSISATGVGKTAWGTIPSGAAGKEVLIRIIGSGGNAAADPALVNIQVQLR